MVVGARRNYAKMHTSKRSTPAGGKMHTGHTHLLMFSSVAVLALFTTMASAMRKLTSPG